MQSFLLPIFCLLAGGTIAWVIRKLLFEKNFVSVPELDAAKKQLNELITQKAVVDSALVSSRTEIERAYSLLHSKGEELIQVRADYTKAHTENGCLMLDVNDRNVEINNLKVKLETAQAEISIAQNRIAKLEAEVVYKTRQLDEQAKSLEDIGRRFEKEFSNLAHKILDEKSKVFGSQQEVSLKLLLEPFKADIANFKKEFSEKHSIEAAERNTLKGVIQEMVNNHKMLSEQANNLTKALTFQSKQQGNWGEEILESILEHCGLQHNIHYFKQYSTKDEDGIRIQPDFIVNCPDNRCVIIDSKVSLSHFTGYCSTNVATEQEAFSKSLLLSIKGHIDGLSGKKYTGIPNTLDTVIMFMPVEPAYILAMQLDQDLWRYAYNKGIVLISPSNLITTIKLISNLWQRDAINKNAKLIAEKAGRLYDKLVGFVDNMKKVGDSLNKANDSWKDAYGQLYKGHGNLINQAESIKTLGIKTGTKAFPAEIISEAAFADTLTLNGEVSNLGEE
ncbi:DNA recombination protein RmuC [Flavisolibacter ginsenosidimutans]|uniref:DNA recombination protein RmuC n=1 Tax=Flavisolibacter ginsenosidimutans TaxID=661481 RepID=A0A5B8UFE3_9BACT|nr:DNA recombination protein RmuC [Flavisolibacter ginsenosidimutans]QEC55284.1 DNA recombination protein RmuC [Flavisolibacter ginsenosidimutans]